MRKEMALNVSSFFKTKYIWHTRLELDGPNINNIDINWSETYCVTIYNNYSLFTYTSIVKKSDTFVVLRISLFRILLVKRIPNIDISADLSVICYKICGISLPPNHM